jgi:zeta-carotene desaturase
MWRTHRRPCRRRQLALERRVVPFTASRRFPAFDKIYNLECVPIATVQLRFNGWVTELHDEKRMKDVSGDQSDGRGAGIDNLLYSADAEFSCFADLALVSPADYYKPGEGSLMQAVFDERAFARSEEQIVADCIEQTNKLFPSSRKLKCTWSSVVKLGQSLYREKPGQDKYRPSQATPIPNFFPVPSLYRPCTFPVPSLYRPSQATPIPNFFLAGSYTYQDYLDSMEGATRSGLMVADEVIARADSLAVPSPYLPCTFPVPSLYLPSLSVPTYLPSLSVPSLYVCVCMYVCRSSRAQTPSAPPPPPPHDLL